MTVVPYRNLVFSAVAAIYAVEQGACAVALATHFTDCSEVYGPYPDCSVIFSESMDVVLSLGHVPGIRYSTPFSHMTKAQILKLGYELGVPLEKTWSCYNNEEKHCGACRSCLTRKAAFVEAGIPDLTPYLK